MPDFAPTDESFLSTATRRRETVMEIPRPAADVWNDLVRDGSLTWNRAITRLTWTSPRPFGVGTTRQIRVLGIFRINERYIAWEEGRRKTFVGHSANLPLLERLAEDYVVEPVTDSSCRFTWTVAWEPSLFADTRKHFGA